VNLTCCFYTVENRHCEVQHHDVGRKATRFFNRLLTINRFAADFPTGVLAKKLF